MARQYGLDNLSQETDYITFIDAGDIVYSSVEFIKYLNIVKENPDTFVFSAAHYSEEPDGTMTYTEPFHNRLHGKIYKTSFLKEYNIRFIDDVDGSKMNEDIGFNYISRFICAYLYSQNEKIPYYINYETPIIFWTYDKDSLTRQGDHIFYYRQNWGLAKNAVHAINLVLNHNVPFSFIKQDLYQILLHLYAFYLSAINVKPEYEKEMFEGAFYFYKNIIVKEPIDNLMLTEVYHNVTAHYINKKEDPYNARIPAVSFYDFLIRLEQSYQTELKKESINMLQQRFA